MPLNPARYEIIDDQMAEVLREMTVQQRLAVANRMWVSANNAIGHILRSEHPDWTHEQVQRETARRMLHGAL
jgi:hypothetical protein